MQHRDQPCHRLQQSSLVILLLSTALVLAVATPLRAVEVIDTGLAEAIGMDFADGVFWVAENLTIPIRIVKFDPQTGAAVGSIPSAVTTFAAARDVVVVGNFIYQAEDFHGNHHIHKILKSTGEPLGEFDHPANFPMGIASDGSFLYVVDNESQVIFKRTLADLSIVDVFTIVDLALPVGQNGLDYVDGKLYLARESTPSVVQVYDPVDGSLIETLGLPDSLAAIGGLMDLEFDGSRFWFLFRDDRIYRGPPGFGGVAIRVSIDVKPGSTPNSVNPRARGVLPVAILTTSTAAGEELDFDATSIDSTSVAFGPDSAEIAHALGHIEDVDRDGDLDLVLHFKTNETGISCGDTLVTLTGTTLDGEPVEGFDTIRTVGCR